jgi:hypothetical protein
VSLTTTILEEGIVPMMATNAEAMMREARWPVHAANQAPNAIPKAANAFGGTVILVHRSESTTKRQGKELTAALSKWRILNQR